MTIVNEINFNAESLGRVRRSVLDVDQSIWRRCLSRDASEDTIERLSDEVEVNLFLQSCLFVKNGMPSGLKKKKQGVASYLRNRKEQMKNEITYVEGSIAANIRSIEQLLTKRLIREATLKRLEREEASPYTIEKFRDDLLSNPNIIPESVRLETFNGGTEAGIRWCFTGISLTPNYNSYINIVHEKVALTDIEVRVNVTTKSVGFYRTGDDTASDFPSGYNGNRTVHPHVLQARDPCLGDFQSNIISAIDDKDFNSVVTILQLFLEQADAYDTAGKHWYKHALIRAGMSTNHVDHTSSFQVGSDNKRMLYRTTTNTQTGEDYYILPFVLEDGMEEHTVNYDEFRLIQNMLERR